MKLVENRNKEFHNKKWSFAIKQIAIIIGKNEKRKAWFLEIERPKVPSF